MFFSVVASGTVLRGRIYLALCLTILYQDKIMGLGKRSRSFGGCVTVRIPDPYRASLHRIRPSSSYFARTNSDDGSVAAGA